MKKNLLSIILVLTSLLNGFSQTTDKDIYSSNDTLYKELLKHPYIDIILENPYKLPIKINKHSSDIFSFDLTDKGLPKRKKDYLDNLNLFKTKIILTLSTLTNTEASCVIKSYSFPLITQFVTTLNSIFQQHYEYRNTNIKNYNLKIKYADIFNANYINLEYIKDKNDTGIALYYAIDTTVNGQKYYTYLITMAKSTHSENKDSIEPMATENLKMITYDFNLNTGGFYKITTSTNFTSKHHKLYKDSVKFHMLTQSSTTTNHGYDELSLICYHSGKKTYEFITDNYSIDSLPQNLYVTINNGALSDCELKRRYQTPILILGLPSASGNGLELLIDDTTYNGKPFRNKALDVGRLCPPECN